MSQQREVLTSSKILEILQEDGGRVHFIGVGGVSMCSLFCLSRYFGILCSGSDRAESEITEALSSAGEDIFVGEREALPTDTRLVVYSHAIDSENRELRLADKQGIPAVTRAEYLGALMSCYEWRVGVSGSHGKSTVTAMIGKIFFDAGLSPTVLSGARLYRSKLPFSIGALDYLVYEACEYKDSFLSFSPTVALFLNMELDHTDYFRDENALASSFLKAMARAETVIVNRDDSALYSLAQRSGKRVISYGASYGCDYRYETISAEAGNIRFRVFEAERELGEVCLSLLGEFNVSNATAAIAAAREVSVEFSAVAKSLSEFCTVERRLERIGNYKGRALYYDYAHHPTEIKASISAVRRALGGKVTVIFRPHTYSRTAGLWEGFKEALSSADFVILLDIDAVREREIAGVSSERLAGEIGARLLCDEVDIDNLLSKTEGSIILMGAADLSGVKKRLTNEK